TGETDQSRELWSEPGFDPNESYLAELGTFLNYVREGRVRHAYDAWEAAHSLAAVVAGFNSAKSGSPVEVSSLIDF
ncbi:MAG TPA: hypothetical protein VKD91_08995, partial [Pyrinomonadaceae bacterium]|nr:hypothetical protein [Pyrinomonadaceae bacterium]